MIRASRSAPDWQSDGADWPNRGASFFHTAAGLSWHIQQMGDGDGADMLLLHGTGAATHSFRDLMPLLANKLRVTAMDLPGHGFTRASGPVDLSLEGMARSIGSLLKSLALKPAGIFGHSAGAAIAIELAMHGAPGLKRLFGVNAALRPIRGNAILSPMAKLLFANPVSSRLFSMTASQSPLGRNLLASAGPEMDKAGHDAYTMLMGFPDHVRGALGMMASWNLNALDRKIPDLKTPLTLITAADDKLVPCGDSANAIRKTPNGELIEFETGGHLLHEVRSAEIADLVLERMLDARKAEHP